MIALMGSLLLIFISLHCLSVTNILGSNLKPKYFCVARIFWSLAICYIIFACVHGHGGVINSLLSLPLWQPLSRLSFVTFLIHIEVVTILIGNRRTGNYFSKLDYVRNVFIHLGRNFSL